ncbi:MULTISPECIES: McrC family protein [Chryseobacterium]|uniref:5-methylcytosine-specific restriction enzyme subunit McrC n=1 Tax=Chryseobacterium camelliae TaxID=1265445 RepID=A0ABU0THN2_9FLAO|nr:MULTISPECIES: restriction endonuclease [Chryseobacterium]MDT3405705.1 5-methylcytosine-specific restriction enzyme subunit McrC [Pseudacidovorax intermedius]MDQ1096486.1 5-methylcytosine-specific restriction enzyme subunit McrC [Chryseobacterium camelliae]MDQ1100426.1 5-methylcytosine-specific restriction enzyme subunit McrC [Chryseobacterium sp. SORGH_AS_1048]MDR6087767.1 5-methylcytosine-specific restriction enzyme subunit McrC [Chryseobacterium sp. SORGH_AS_0909]MDR6132143.1 5-methylcyto
MTKKNIIQVFEHSFLATGDKGFNNNHFVALSKLNALHNYQYFDLKHNGVVFKQYVGVIQVDGLSIEILPKIDRYESDTEENKSKWQNVLIQMLKATRKLKIQQVGQANVSRQSIHLLDIYFEWFLDELWLLIHQGLIKQYYRQTGNVKALKGKLEFAGHIQRNLVHKERFYTTHQVYKKDHLIHQILNQALNIIAEFSKGTYIYSKCKTVQLGFPEVKLIKANDNTFSKIPKSRKTAPYETALSIARLIILNYAPNVSDGSEKMLALLFDMNRLWEEYVLVKLKQAAEGSGISIYGQNSKPFWNGIYIRPDIVVEKESEVKLIIDTKWKNIDQSQPSTHDLRQMYVYNEYWDSGNSLLLYPANNVQDNTNVYNQFVPLKNNSHHHCGLGKISVLDKDGKLDQDIGKKILDTFITKA